ncbi:hypothetical protein PsAD2_03213 [Pseudovibrio axinellae]|uniref:Sulfotransferase domain protein n=1 Tax=Pseudovibrio axinellae TaxID=989403 RepID=A0A165WZE8_9HYPH|nr:sulfotransferase [Pseudovibrio axinellae]KZL17188.1 hypothetical protein PsAD2_03213 [Pseudovibrio axinellae]SER92507.1 hypothetical protein SAMN05421798_1642 [Pseudovibrio axinellae]
MIGHIGKSDHLTAVLLLYMRKMMAAPPKHPFIKYENFVIDPKPELMKVLDHLGLDWEDKLLNAHQMYNEGELGHGRIKLWKPIHQESLDKYKSINQETFDKIYSIASPALDLYGYEIDDKNDIVFG